MTLTVTLMTSEAKLSDNIINRHSPKNDDKSSTLVIKEDCLNTTQEQEPKHVNETITRINNVTENEPKNNTIVNLEENPSENRVHQSDNNEVHEQNTHFPDNASLPEAITPPIPDNQMEVETRYPHFKTHEIKALPATSVQISRDITDNPSSDLKRRSDGDEQAKLDSLDMRKYHDRLKTYANWPISFLKPETLANNGFYYLNRGDEVRCAFCKVEIMRWEPGDDPAADHKKWAPQCPFLRNAPGDRAAPVGRDECGVRMASADTAAPLRLGGPANPRYNTLAARLDSFKEWPLSLRQKPKDLADAGFFYTGHGDKTKCFYCDGGLKDWEDDDVPWEQHARWFDRCAFVMLVKGREYVQRVLADVSLIRAKPPATAATSPPAVASPALHTDSEPATAPASELPATTAAEDEKLCKICYEQERNVCFVPCGHVVACATCALSTTKCPLCRRTFANAVRLYYA